MKDFFKFIFIFFIIPELLLAAVPVIKVTELEPKETLELYEDSEGIFSIRVIDYYRMALMLETQLKIMGITPKTQIFAPTYEEFEELDAKIIRKYYKMAKSLEDEVIAAPESDRIELLNRINQLEKSMRDSIAVYTVAKGEAVNKALDISLKRLKSQDETYMSNLELLQEQYDNECLNSYTLLSISGSFNMFFSNGGNNLRNDPWLAVKGTVNAGRIAGFWKDFNLWYEYLSPRFFTQYQIKNYEYRETWNTNAHAVGIGGKVPISEVKNFKHGLNLELGYFWLKGNITNIPIGNVDWDGVNLNLEYYAGVPSCRYPFELFFDLSVYHSFSKNLHFRTGMPGFEDLNLGKTHLALSFGIRYNLLRTPFE